MPQRNKHSHQTFRSHLILSLLIALVAAQALPTYAQKYSDWSTPINLGTTINSTANDQQPAISKDGLSLYFASNRTGGMGGFDMYVSQRADVNEAWGSPLNLGPTVNSASNEGNPAFSRDEHLMFFQSDRSGGFGNIDIWVSSRGQSHDVTDWQTPTNLGSGVNSTAGDNAPTYFENDELGVPQLYFASNRTGGSGGLDIYLSEQTEDGSFGPAVLVAELNSVAGDSRPSIGHNGLEIFLQSDRGGTTGGNDLWVATRPSTLEAWSTVVNLGLKINTTFSEQNPYLSSNGEILLFSSDRPAGLGGPDLYVSTRAKLRGQ